MTVLPPGAHCALIDSDRYLKNLVLSDTTAIAPSVTIRADNITIARSLYLANHGDVRADISLCDYCNVFIQNSGKYDGVVHVPHGAMLTRVINSAADISDMDIDGEYNLLVRGADGMSMADIMAHSFGATKVTLENSSLVYAPAAAASARTMFAPSFEVVGNLKIILPGDINLDGVRLLSDVSGDGTIIIDAPGLDILYAYAPFADGNDIYLRMVRETDYYKIFGDDTGVFLNVLRTVNPDDKLLAAMDRAENMDALRHVMARSVVLNPRRLMNPVKAFDTFARTDEAFGDAGFYAAPEYVVSDDFYINAATLKLGMKFGDTVGLTLGAHAGLLDYADDINEYGATLYGGDVALTYAGRHVDIRAIAGATFAKFDAPLVFHDGELESDPSGFSGYGDVRLGVPLHMGTEFTMMPFVGISLAGTRMFGVTDTDNAAVRVGSNITYSVRIADIRYDYGVRGAIENTGAYDAGLFVGYFSDGDMSGGDVGVELHRDDFAVSYKIRLGIKMLF